MADDLKPEHVEFARALVALARQHKVGSLTVEFRDSASAINSGRDFWSWKQVKMTWAEGRHGADTRITLRHEAETQVDERAPDGVPACDTPAYCSSVRRCTRADSGKHPKCATVPVVNLTDRPCGRCDAPPGAEHAQSCPTRGVDASREPQEKQQ